MDHEARHDYLYTEVMTAAPQKLQLMLIDAAIRLVHRAQNHWERNDDHTASEALIRCQQVMSELLGGVDVQSGNDLVRRVASVYLFVYRSLVLANLERSREKLADVLRVLEIERQTWADVCQQLGTEREASTARMVS